MCAFDPSFMNIFLNNSWQTESKRIIHV